MGTQGPPNEDLYQMLACCVSLGLPAGLLIYAGERLPRERYLVERAGVTLEATGIDLTGEPANVLARTRATARRLIGQAERTRFAGERVAN